ncbi:hypothetical protein [Weissella confusa]|uniref:hypothetical protein n=1 Tax=Weissella confusa TaxID=1583 RepID=UPI001785B70B|nr:hypothetical protein [Weissella confusa]MBD5832683.1 hypothetical protein [Weissella confusa]
MYLNNKSYNSFIAKWNSFDEDELRYQSYGLLVMTILDKGMFKKNSDLHSLLDNFILDSPLKEYLYLSRTQLSARLIREFNKMEFLDLQKNIKMMVDYIEGSSYTVSSSFNEMRSVAKTKPKSNKSDDLVQKNIDLLNRYRRRKNDE